jgi:hypothetical protein
MEKNIPRSSKETLLAFCESEGSVESKCGAPAVPASQPEYQGGGTLTRVTTEDGRRGLGVGLGCSEVAGVWGHLEPSGGNQACSERGGDPF